jgi:gas vesicle protein GvpL/GvpF
VEAVARVIGGASPIIYMYGFVRLPIGLPDDLRAVEDDTAVLVVASDGIACVASAVDASAYQPAEPRSPQKQLEWVTPRALRHHELLQRVHATTAVIPLKFGTLAPNLDAVRTVLLDRGAAIAAMLQRFHARDEWTLRISIDAAALAAGIEASDPRIAAARTALAGLSDGHAWFARKRLQKAIDEGVAAARAALEQRVCARLAGDPSVAALVGEPRTAASDHLAGAALLVARDGFTRLQSLLAELEDEHRSSGLAFDLVGPWPPYSFAAAIA